MLWRSGHKARTQTMHVLASTKVGDLPPPPWAKPSLWASGPQFSYLQKERVWLDDTPDPISNSVMICHLEFLPSWSPGFSHQIQWSSAWLSIWTTKEAFKIPIKSEFLGGESQALVTFQLSGKFNENQWSNSLNLLFVQRMKKGWGNTLFPSSGLKPQGSPEPVRAKGII